MGKFYKLFWVLLFLVGATVPLFHMNTAKISEQENRTLAKFPEMRKKGKLNANYGKEFETWLGDRFWGRDLLITINDRVKFINEVIQNKRAVFFRKSGWMFQKDPFFLKVPQYKMEKTLKHVEKFDKFCSDNGIKLYILVVPLKEEIYFDLYENSGKTDQTDEYLSFLEPIRQRLGNIFVFPYKELKEASKSDFVFFKVSHHWTDYGAYIGYSKLMDSIQKDFPDAPKVSLDSYKEFKNKMIREDWKRNFDIGQTAKNLLHIRPNFAKQYILETDYIYYDPLTEIKPVTKDISNYRIKYFRNQDDKMKYKVFLSGFSQNENLLQFLPYSFSELKYYRLNNVKDVKMDNLTNFMKRYKKDLLEYNPDILILTISMQQFFSNGLWKLE